MLPSSWSQFHANGPSLGYVPTHTLADLGLIWEAEVGDPGFGCPVIGPGGSIYTINRLGEIRRFTANGVLTNYDDVGAGLLFYSAPAVDNEGRVYVIGIDRQGQEKFWDNVQSTLFCLKPEPEVAGAGFFRLWQHEFPRGGETLAAPKLWREGLDTRIFVLMRYGNYGSSSWSPGLGSRLNVLDALGNEVTSSLGLGLQLLCTPPDYAGSPVDTGGLAGEFETESDANENLALEPFAYWSIAQVRVADPTPAVTDFGDGKALVVIADNFCGVQAWVYDPSMSTPPSFFGWSPMWQQLWFHENPGDPAYSSPALSLDGVVAVGTDLGHVLAYDAVTGTQLLDCFTGRPMLGTPALFLGLGNVYIYASSMDWLFQIDASGNIVEKVAFPSRRRITSSPAASWDRVYLAAADGFHSFSFDLMSDIVDPLAPGSSSSCIIGPRGRVMVVTADGMLRVYAKPNDDFGK
jgi:hypothetical protein